MVQSNWERFEKRKLIKIFVVVFFKDLKVCTKKI